MLRVVLFGALIVLCGPVGAFAQTAAPWPSPSPVPAGMLPFGRIKFGPNGIDRSGLVWSQCRGADGQAGRWSPVESPEVVHPTYIIDRFALPRTAPEFSRPSTFYECIGADGNPGTPDPALPPASSLPVGTKLVWESGVTIRRAGDTDKDGLEVMYSSGGRAFTDAVGPVVVSGDRITVFPGVQHRSEPIQPEGVDRSPRLAGARRADLVHGRGPRSVRTRADSWNAPETLHRLDERRADPRRRRGARNDERLTRQVHRLDIIRSRNIRCRYYTLKCGAAVDNENVRSVRIVALVAGLFLMAAQSALAEDRAAFSGSFSVVLNTPPQRALPLFDPVGEAAWAPGWAPVFAREADRTALPDGAVFTTRGHGERPSTWVLQRYDRRAGAIVYTVFDPADVVVGIHVIVRERAPGTSEALVRYDVVATSAAGDRFVQEFGSSFPHMQPHWQHALDAALAHQP